ncbi:ankyrin repeat domain-containing protein, partial [Candidatus Babeliales bacterium]|nr:ankyrin repeat domain-containing protein [Candidatus Babeliales bacterium]
IILNNTHLETTNRADPNRTDLFKLSPISWAITLLTRTLESSNDIEKYRSDSECFRNKVTYFSDLSEKFTTIIQTLLEHGADANTRDLQHLSPLEWAVLYENTELVQMLLNAKANPHLETFEGSSPLLLSILIGKKTTAIFLLSNQPCDNLKKSSSQDEYRRNHPDSLD